MSYHDDAACVRLQQYEGYLVIPRSKTDEPPSKDNPEHIIVVRSRDAEESFPTEMCFRAISETFTRSLSNHAGSAAAHTRAYDFVQFGPLLANDCASGRYERIAGVCSVIHAINVGERRFHHSSCNASRCWGHESQTKAESSGLLPVSTAVSENDQAATFEGKGFRLCCNVYETKDSEVARDWVEEMGRSERVREQLENRPAPSRSPTWLLEAQLDFNYADRYYQEDGFWEADDAPHAIGSELRVQVPSVPTASYRSRKGDAQTAVAGRHSRQTVQAYYDPKSAVSETAARTPLRQHVVSGIAISRVHVGDQDGEGVPYFSTTDTWRYHPSTERDCLRRGFSTAEEAMAAEEVGRSSSFARLRGTIRSCLMDSLDRHIRARDITALSGVLAAWPTAAERKIADLFPGMAEEITGRLSQVYTESGHRKPSSAKGKELVHGRLTQPARFAKKFWHRSSQNPQGGFDGQGSDVP